MRRSVQISKIRIVMVACALWARLIKAVHSAGILMELFIETKLEAVGNIAKVISERSKGE